MCIFLQHGVYSYQKGLWGIFIRRETFQSRVYSTVRDIKLWVGKLVFFFLSSIMKFWGETVESNIRKYMQPSLLFLILGVV